jgi:PleD family two-component response regulator
MKEKPGALVFVVDDEPVIAQSLAMILEHSGYSARPFTDPLEALANVSIDCPDLLIARCFSSLDRLLRLTYSERPTRRLIASQCCPSQYTPRICFVRFAEFKTLACELLTTPGPLPALKKSMGLASET